MLGDDSVTIETKLNFSDPIKINLILPKSALMI